MVGWKLCLKWHIRINMSSTGDVTFGRSERGWKRRGILFILVQFPEQIFLRHNKFVNIVKICITPSKPKTITKLHPLHIYITTETEDWINSELHLKRHEEVWTFISVYDILKPLKMIFNFTKLEVYLSQTYQFDFWLIWDEVPTMVGIAIYWFQIHITNELNSLHRKPLQDYCCRNSDAQ
jgi:hypothetical protein